MESMPIQSLQHAGTAKTVAEVERLLADFADESYQEGKQSRPAWGQRLMDLKNEIVERITPPAATDGRELPEPDYVEMIPPTHFKDEPTVRHWYSAETLHRMMQATPPAAAVPDVLQQLQREAAEDKGWDYTEYERGRLDEKKRCISLLSAAPQPQAEASVPKTDFDWALNQGGILAEWCNMAALALRDLMTAYERRVRSDCASQEQLNSQPWRCAEFVRAEQVLSSQPVWLVMVPQAEATQHPATCKPDLQVQEEASTDDGIAGARTVQGSTATHAYYEQPEAKAGADDSKSSYFESMVRRFLEWKLPADFAPDAGIIFDRKYCEKWRTWPTGTNLLTAAQAAEMLSFMLEPAAAGAPSAKKPLDESAKNAGVATGSRKDSPSERVTRGNQPP